MSITDVNNAPGRTPASHPNQAFTNIVKYPQASQLLRTLTDETSGYFTLAAT